MSTRKKPLEKSQFSLSAMVDVVFLLLLFFVATYVSAKTEAFMSVDNPSRAPGPSKPMLEAEVHSTGYRFMGRPMQLDRMEAQLMDIAALDDSSAVFIKVAPSATEGQLLALLDRCKKVKLNNLNIQTLKND